MLTATRTIAACRCSGFGKYNIEDVNPAAARRFARDSQPCRNRDSKRRHQHPVEDDGAIVSLFCRPALPHVQAPATTVTSVVFPPRSRSIADRAAKTEDSSRSALQSHSWIEVSKARHVTVNDGLRKRDCLAISPAYARTAAGAPVIRDLKRDARVLARASARR
jgi:hypothetical protein